MVYNPLTKLNLEGWRQRKTELPNQVYIKATEYDCMTEVFMPSVVRNARPEQAVEQVRQEAKAMRRTNLRDFDQEGYDRLSVLQRSALALPYALREALADNDAPTMEALARQYREGDFVSINFGVISTVEMLDALKGSSKLPSAFYERELRCNANDLGAGYHLELGLKRNRLTGHDRFVGLYVSSHPEAEARARNQVESAQFFFASPSAVRKLSPLSADQYAATGLDLAHIAYQREHQEATAPTESPLETIAGRGSIVIQVGGVILLVEGASSDPLGQMFLQEIDFDDEE